MNPLLLERVERLANRVLQLDPEAVDALKAFTGSVMEIELANTGMKFQLVIDDRGIKILQQTGVTANVVMRATPLELLNYIGAARSTGVLRSGSMEIKGDIALAQQLQAVIKRIEPDWEEYLAQWLGDTAAHKTARLLRSAVSYCHRTMQTLTMDISEFLRYEKEVLIVEPEIDEFSKAVDALRNDVQRLKQRIDRLQHRIVAE